MRFIYGVLFFRTKSYAMKLSPRLFKVVQILYLPVENTKLHMWYIMTSSNRNIFRVTGHLCGNSPVPGEFPARRPVTRSFDVLFDLRLNKRLLSKQSWGWWFETLSHPLWRHCNTRLWCCSVANEGIIDVKSAMVQVMALHRTCGQWSSCS